MIYMQSKTNKILIIAIVALFFVATMPLVSATDRVIESKTGGDEVTETFNLCRITSSGYGFSVHVPIGLSGKGIYYLDVDYFGLNNTTTTIKTSKGTLTIEGEHEIVIGREKPRIIKFLEDFHLPVPRFFGKYTLPLNIASFGDVYLDGYGIGVEVTYYT